MARSTVIPSRPYAAFLTSFLALLLAAPALPYDVPFSESSIRDAYFLGTRAGATNATFLATYDHWIPELKQWTCTSRVRVETPFLQVAEYASQVPNYTAQDAVKDFYEKPPALKMYLDICYMEKAPADALRIRFIQNKKTLSPLLFRSSPYYPVIDERAILPANGERIYVEFNPRQVDSSTLTIVIDTPNGQHVAADFDLGPIR